MMPLITRRSLPALVAAAAAVGAKPSRAADGPKVLNVGTGGAFTSIDPHYHNLTPNNVVSYHLFNGLMTIGPTFKPEPALATGWTATDDHTWEFKLRPGVLKFSDGTPLDRRTTWSSPFERMPDRPQQPVQRSTARRQTRRSSLEIVDPLTDPHAHQAEPAAVAPLFS